MHKLSLNLNHLILFFFLQLILLKAVPHTASADASESMHFTDISTMSNLSPAKHNSYSAAAGDYNRDGYPDIIISHHGTISLWQNDTRNKFINTTEIIRDLTPRADTHGVSFIDINNDNFIDIAVSVGGKRGRGKGANQFYINNSGGNFQMIPDLKSLIIFPEGRGRSIIPVDFNNDDNLDILLFNYNPNNTGGHQLFQKTNSVSPNYEYQNISLPDIFGKSIVFECKELFLSEVRKYYLLSGPGPDSGKVFKKSAAGEMHDVTKELGIENTGWVTVVPLDFDNDGDLDLFYSKTIPPLSNVSAMYQGKIYFLLNNRNITQGFRAKVNEGLIRLNIRFEGREKLINNLYLGKQRKNIPETPWELKVTSSELEGDPKPDPQKDSGGFLWYEASTSTLQYQFIGGDSLHESGGVIEPIDFKFEEVVFQNIPQKQKITKMNSLYENKGGIFVDVTSKSGISGTGRSTTAIAADFDNDGFQDIYTVNIGQSIGDLNPPNQLYLNNGNGTFTEIAGQANAIGTDTGIGTGVIALDYDQDGDLDIFLHNGNVIFPAPPGEFVLLRNDLPKPNRSVIFDLKGKSITQGWGASVSLNLGKKGVQIQQKHSLNGFLATSDLPIHFGIGDSNEIMEAIIRWPSGQEQVIKNIKPGSRLVVKEEIRIPSKSMAE